MAAIWRALGISNSTQLPKSEDKDQTYPLHMLDDTKTLRGIVVTWTLRFNDVLDADMLHGSLSRLLEIGDWRKLGGRLRLNNDGALEIVVPSTFTVQQPAVFYTHQAISANIEEHELAKTLPSATDGPSFHPRPNLFRSFAARDDAPSKLEDFLNGDTPQLSLHVTSFHDATLVALSWPHTLMDVMGQQALLRAWSLVLAGKESEVPPLLGAREDAISAAADAAGDQAENFKLGSLRIKGTAMFKFGLRFAWDMLWNGALETRTICLPKSTITALRKEAEADLSSHDEKAEKAFISDGDILTAWMVRMVASSLPRPRPITVLHALNARFRLKHLMNTSGVYVQNMAVAAFTFLPFEMTMGSLGISASRNRSDLIEQSSETQVLAFIRELQQETKSGGDPASFLCGDSNALLVPFTNWTRADLFAAVDFSPAIVRTGESHQSRINPPGTMIFHHASSMQQSSSIGNVVVVLGKDQCGNYWLTATLLPASWSAMEDEFARLHQQSSRIESVPP